VNNQQKQIVLINKQDLLLKKSQVDYYENMLQIVMEIMELHKQQKMAKGLDQLNEKGVLHFFELNNF